VQLKTSMNANLSSLNCRFLVAMTFSYVIQYIFSVGHIVVVWSHCRCLVTLSLSGHIVVVWTNCRCLTLQSLSDQFAVVWLYCRCLATMPLSNLTANYWSHCCCLVRCHCLVTLSLSVTWLDLVLVSKNKKDKKGTWCGQRYEIDPGLEIPGATLPPPPPPPSPRPEIQYLAALLLSITFHKFSGYLTALPSPQKYICSPELSCSPFLELLGSGSHVNAFAAATNLVLGYLPYLVWPEIFSYSSFLGPPPPPPISWDR
jgi:hypothetical protein